MTRHSKLKTDSKLANQLRNILAALDNLKTQVGDLFPQWQKVLDIHIDYLEIRLADERRPSSRRKKPYKRHRKNT